MHILRVRLSLFELHPFYCEGGRAYINPGDLFNYPFDNRLPAINHDYIPVDCSHHRHVHSTSKLLVRYRTP